MDEAFADHHHRQQRLQSQLELLQLLTSMYTSDELVLLDSTQLILDTYNSDSDVMALRSSFNGTENLGADLILLLDEYDKDSFSDESIRFQISMPVCARQGEDGDSAVVKIRFKQPSWLSRNLYETITDSIRSIAIDDEPSEYLLSTVEEVRESLKSAYLGAKRDQEPQLQLQSNGSGRSKGEWAYDAETTPIDRVWFWFPTLSTREKRDDLVNYANEMALTGFVLAGKPALLCVEGPGYMVDKYMSRIKSESWSDIPSNHKKSMSEVTHLVPKYGQYNHRGDMSEVRRLMNSWGVGDDFADVVLGG
ncbi:hypothetical protein I317_02079 [Kwoniella heveanensis CBS 569]|nr:hypothetical protein I317_02079 [Kwoniella heveanensis CBS 569]